MPLLGPEIAATSHTIDGIFDDTIHKILLGTSSSSSSMFPSGEYAWLISHQQASWPACFSTASSSIPHPMGDSWLATYHWLWSSASLGKTEHHSLVAAESRVPLASLWLLASVPYWSGCCRKLIRCLDGVDAPTTIPIHTTTTYRSALTHGGTGGSRLRYTPPLPGEETC